MFSNHTQSYWIWNQFGLGHVRRAEEVPSRWIPVYIGRTSTGPKQSQWSLNGHRTSYGGTENMDSADNAIPRFLLAVSLWKSTRSSVHSRIFPNRISIKETLHLNFVVFISQKKKTLRFRLDLDFEKFDVRSRPDRWSSRTRDHLPD